VSTVSGRPYLKCHHSQSLRQVMHQAACSASLAVQTMLSVLIMKAVIGALCEVSNQRPLVHAQAPNPPAQHCQMQQGISFLVCTRIKDGAR